MARDGRADRCADAAMGDRHTGGRDPRCVAAFSSSDGAAVDGSVTGSERPTYDLFLGTAMTAHGTFLPWRAVIWFSLGRSTTESEIDHTVTRLKRLSL